MIDDHESEEYEYHCLDEQKDPVKKWFEIYLRDFKQNPIKVNNGQKIDIMFHSIARTG